jgi:hypothetical protein
MTPTLTGALARVLAAHNPPNPAPTMTTPGGASERAIDEMATNLAGYYIAPVADIEMEPKNVSFQYRCLKRISCEKREKGFS